MEYHGIVIRKIQDKNQTLWSLTDMWKDRGSTKNQKPTDWLRSSKIQDLIKEIESQSGKFPLWTIKGGKYN